MGNTRLTHAKDFAEMCKTESLDSVQRVIVFDLNDNFELIEKRVVVVGSTHVNPTLIFRDAMKNGASKVVIVHNHTDGDSTPSDYDIRATSRYKFLGNMLEIRVLDSIIVSKNGWTSMKATNSGALDDEDMKILQEILTRIVPEVELPVSLVTPRKTDSSVN